MGMLELGRLGFDFIVDSRVIATRKVMANDAVARFHRAPSQIADREDAGSGLVAGRLPIGPAGQPALMASAGRDADRPKLIDLLEGDALRRQLLEIILTFGGLLLAFIMAFETGQGIQGPVPVIIARSTLDRVIGIRPTLHALIVGNADVVEASRQVGPRPGRKREGEEKHRRE